MIPSTHTGSCIHSFNKYLLSTNCKPGTALGVGDKAIEKKKQQYSCLTGTFILIWVKKKKKNHIIGQMMKGSRN